MAYSRTSLDVDMRVADDFLPLVGFGLDEAAELLRRAHCRFEAKLGKAFLNLGLRHRFGNLVMKLVDDRFWRAGRHRCPNPESNLVALDALFFQCRDVGDHRRTLVVGDGKT